MIYYLLDKITPIHNYLVSEPVITEDYLKTHIYKNILDKDLNPTTFKSIYSHTYFLIANTIGYIFNINNPTHLVNKKYVQDILLTSNIEQLENQLTYTSKNFFLNTAIVKKNPYMKEIIEKTEAITNKDNEGYHSLTKYVGGVCWVNAKLSNGFEITPDEKIMMDTINSVIKRVEPLSYPVTLFHGFEYYTKYSNYKVGDVVQVGGFLSKTLSFNIALSFAQYQNLMKPRFLIVHYPTGTKQVHHDIRPFNNEFEFITKSNEKLCVKKIISYYDITRMMIPTYLTFYICEPIN